MEEEVKEDEQKPEELMAIPVKYLDSNPPRNGCTCACHKDIFGMHIMHCMPCC